MLPGVPPIVPELKGDADTSYFDDIEQDDHSPTETFPTPTVSVCMSVWVCMSVCMSMCINVGSCIHSIYVRLSVSMCIKVCTRVAVKDQSGR